MATISGAVYFALFSQTSYLTWNTPIDLPNRHVPTTHRYVYSNQFKSRIKICLALLSVYDKSNLLELAKGLRESGVRLLGSGGTAKKIRDAGIPIE
jgi:hypothetical protein